MNVSFSEALVLVRQGARMYRSGWSNKAAIIYLEPARILTAGIDAFPLSQFFDTNYRVTYPAYIAMLSDGEVDAWTPTQADMLSNDWERLEDQGRVGEAP